MVDSCRSGHICIIDCHIVVVILTYMLLDLLGAPWCNGSPPWGTSDEFGVKVVFDPGGAWLLVACGLELLELGLSPTPPSCYLSNSTNIYMHAHGVQ